MYAELPLIFLNGIHHVIPKVITAEARKDKACAAIKNYMNTPLTRMVVAHKICCKKSVYEQHSIE